MRLTLFLALFTWNAVAASFVLNVTKQNETETGVAFFIEKDGLALTALHVVDGASEIIAKVDNKNLVAEVIAFDEVLDVAMLRVSISSKKFYEIQQGTAIGSVVTIGGTGGSIVWRGLDSVITDIDISRGFSGSPVLCDKKACGLVTSFDKSTSNAIAIRGDRLLQKIPFLKEGISFKRKNAGIYVMNLTANVAPTLGVDMRNVRGVLVTKVQENSVFQPWDIITHVNSVPVNGTESLQRIILRAYENDQLNAQIIRNKQRSVVSF